MQNAVYGNHGTEQKLVAAGFVDGAVRPVPNGERDFVQPFVQGRRFELELGVDAALKRNLLVKRL